MPRSSPTIEQILTMLAEAPPSIAAWTAGLPPAHLRAAPNPGEWSANEVLAHLRACADVWGECMVTILNQATPTIRAVNPRTWIKGTDYLDQAFHASLQAFAAQRTALLAILEPLPPASWLRSATITGAGKVLVRTVHSYAQWMAEHERSHLKQIKHIAKTLRLQQGRKGGDE